MPWLFPRHLHLQGAALSLLCVGAILGAGALTAMHLERRYIHGIAPETFSLKNQSVALQRVAFEQPDLLPLYGSSELVKDVPDKAARFFRHYPTEFNVFPIGKAGTTPLIILQKLASIGPALRDRKVAISISPGWFFNAAINPRYYEGNFSALQAGEFIFSDRLDPELKRDVARRMLDFPETLAKRPMLGFAVKRIASDTWLDRRGFGLFRALGWADQMLGRAQDHFETATFILRHHLHSSPRRRPGELNWPGMLGKAIAHTHIFAEETPEDEREWNATRIGGDDGFVATLQGSEEWTNLELLLRTLRELHVQPLLLSMPINGRYFDHVGVSPAARNAYYERLRSLAGQYEVPLVDFREHDEDARFTVDHHDHLSIAGWMYYDEVLDAFFHDRLKLLAASTPRTR